MIMGWYNDELYHHGIRGQKWGVRRFQKSDGSLTMEGKRRYAQEEVEKKLNSTETKTEKFQKEWVKKHPHSDFDDLGDDMIDNPRKYKGLYDEDKEYVKKQHMYADKNKLSDDYVKTQATGTAIITSCLLSPIAGIAVGAATKSATKGLMAAIGTTSAMSLYAAADAKKEQNKTIEKYYRESQKK